MTTAADDFRDALTRALVRAPRLTVELHGADRALIIEHGPRRIDTERYAVRRGSTWTDDVTGRLVDERTAAAIEREQRAIRGARA